MKKLLAVFIFTSTLLCPFARADWPMVRGNAARGGYTPEPLSDKLSLRWVYKPIHGPRPAWPISERLHDDRAPRVVAAEGKVFFGSSADCHLYALDAATGREAWSFATDAPVRFAPALWKGPGPGRRRLFAVSDDGVLYCLDAATGKLIRRRRGGPDRRMLLGNGRMISRWPARGGPVVVDNTVYFGAGIWPSEGVRIYAIAANDGKTIWCNDRSGGIEMPQPHGGAVAKSGIAAQGYLVAAENLLFVPTGRAVPAALDRKSGQLKYFHLQRYGKWGGSATAVVGKYLLNRDQVFDRRTGSALFGGMPAWAMANTPEGIVYYADGDRKICMHDRDKPMVIREVIIRGKKRHLRIPSAKWSVETDVGGGSLIVAGGRIISGGKGKVAVINIATRQVVWSADVAGQALSLAAADGQLYISTDSGAIYCFSRSQAKPTTVAPARQARPYGDNSALAAAAKAILDKTGIREGYCVDLGCGDGALAYELARQSKLTVYAVDSDAALVAAARKKLRSAGLYGVRVTVHRADPSSTPYPDYFADLAVSSASLRRGVDAAPSSEVHRLLRPGGGTACLGRVDAMKLTVRKRLSGAGTWTHQYADPANTTCGDDRLVRAPLGLLWFDGPKIRLPNRHGRGPSPLSDGSRLFVLGRDALGALDIYNGRMLWKYPLPGVLKPFHQEHLMGTAGTGSNICLGPGKVFVHTGDRCLVLDAATGKKLTAHAAPKLPDGKPGRWGYIAFADGMLLGTLVDERHLVPYRFLESDMSGMFSESRVLFALDPATGKERWRYVAKASIRHNAIATGLLPARSGRKRCVFLIDRPKAAEALRGRRQTTQPTGALIALDADTGKVVWQNDRDIYGTMLAVGETHDVLLMCYQSTRFRLNSEVGGRMTAMRASTGKRIWDIKAGYASRPLISERTIYAQPGAWDLLTSKRRMSATDPAQPWTFQRSYGCGIISGAANLLLFRSATLGYRDLLADSPTANFGGIRPGCWINTIPAGGLVLMSDARAWCGCSYLNSATIALRPMSSGKGK